MVSVNVYEMVSINVYETISLSSYSLMIADDGVVSYITLYPGSYLISHCIRPYSLMIDDEGYITLYQITSPPLNQTIYTHVYVCTPYDIYVYTIYTYVYEIVSYHSVRPASSWCAGREGP